MRHSVRLLFVMSLLLAADHIDLFFRTSLKYVPIVLIVGLVLYWGVAGRFSLNRPRWPVWVFFAVFLLALPGLFYNKISGEPSSLFTAVFLGLLVWFAQLVPVTRGSIDARAWLRAIERL